MTHIKLKRRKCHAVCNENVHNNMLNQHSVTSMHMNTHTEFLTLFQSDLQSMLDVLAVVH